MSSTSPSSPRALLAQLLQEGRCLIGEILLSSDFSLRHREDNAISKEELTIYSTPQEARKIARYDKAGNYRSLKTAPTLCRGWLLECENLEGMYLALDFFYPAALSLYWKFLESKLETTSLRETLGRQTGMYRVTQQLSDDDAHDLIATGCCSNKNCLRQLLWSVAPGLPVPSFSLEKTPVISDSEIPLLCREACNLLVASAREKIKSKRE